MNEPCYPICPDCQENLTVQDILHVCPGCGLTFNVEPAITPARQRLVRSTKKGLLRTAPFSFQLRPTTTLALAAEWA